MHSILSKVVTLKKCLQDGRVPEGAVGFIIDEDVRRTMPGCSESDYDKIAEEVHSLRMNGKFYVWFKDGNKICAVSPEEIVSMTFSYFIENTGLKK